MQKPRRPLGIEITVESINSLRNSARVPRLSVKSAKHPGQFVSPKQMIQKLKEPGMWDARHELVEGWACKNASRACEGGD